MTGASSGIGRAIATRFAEHGADVVVADVQSEPRGGGRPTHELIGEETTADATFVECDVTELADLEATMDAADGFGGVEIMVNNAGVYRLKEFLTVTEDDFDWMTGVNQKGVFFGAQAAAERMIGAGTGGCIVNMSSIAGIQGFPTSSLYCMTKGGVRLLTYSLAAELGSEGIRVNAIHPGTIRTSMTTEDEPHLEGEAEAEARDDIALREIGEPGDVADAALYLASDLGGYVTGESITVDGGMVNVG